MAGYASMKNSAAKSTSSRGHMDGSPHPLFAATFSDNGFPPAAARESVPFYALEHFTERQNKAILMSRNKRQIASYERGQAQERYQFCESRHHIGGREQSF